MQVNTWETPNPGPWQQDSAHSPCVTTAALNELYPDGFNRGFSETFARYGVLLDRLAMASINGFTYHQPQPFDMPGPDGPLTPEQIGAEIERRASIAGQAFETKLWRHDLELWDSICKPQAIAKHREFADVELESLTDDELADHLRRVTAHLSEMVYQHHRFNVAAMMPVGDFALHVAGWTGRPPTEAFGVLDGYSPVSGSLPQEMVDAVEAIRSNDEMRTLLDGDGALDADDASARLDQLRAALPEVDEYVRSVDYRVIEGFDITGPTLREQPDVILGKLATGLHADAEEARRRSDAVAARLRADVPSEHQDEFDELLGEARAVYRLRDERGLYSDVAAIGLLRLTMLEVGRRAAERGSLDDREQVLDATVDETIALLDGAGPAADDLAARAEFRRALNADGAPRHLGPPPPPPPPLDALPPALGRVMAAVGLLIEGVLGELDAAAGDDSTVIGIPGNVGVHEGVARRIDEMEDLLLLEDGEILVARSTGEAFNAMLHRVGGIVTDHGSFACHAAIMAREIGFPAVVGTVNATDRIATGDRIRIDGSKGEVTIL
ncbi:PEP-utilizing enzyme [Ilumatobacter nonamiensis]|uniref:PEP-utilizing enzyme n=1 Tax=Ilumatobacter nonamiensis TaxID=467093 RepID=UPI00034B2AE0|nr:PEP-utilizing enzyme [Ilumatobacter nonamiensis]